MLYCAVITYLNGYKHFSGCYSEKGLGEIIERHISLGAKSVHREQIKKEDFDEWREKFNS